MRLQRVIMVVAAFLVASLAMQAQPAAAQQSEAGDVRFVKRAGSDFDRFTRTPTPAIAAWMREHYWRIETFTPYWDDKTSWYGDTWVYQDLYAIYVDSDVARAHPEWILRDAAGNKLYIPWGCENGTCPQYAGDVGNPEFRRWWIDRASRAVAKGHRGLWVDDVNMEMRVGDGSGREIAPQDARTGGAMSRSTWRRYVAEFTEQLAAAVPAETEIMHNAIWYGANGDGRDEDPYVRRQLAAADIINLERGINDGGLTGGTGEWSLRSFLGYIDRRHAEGKAVVLDQFADTRAGREYGLAGYFLVSSGRDGVGNDSASSPDDWWKGYDASLGAPRGPRYEWQGLLRRDFANGVVLLNEPGAPQRTVDVGSGLLDLDGRATAKVTLGAARGAVLVTPGGAAAPTAAPPATPAAQDAGKVVTTVKLEGVPLSQVARLQAPGTARAPVSASRAGSVPAALAPVPAAKPKAKRAVVGRVVRGKGGGVRLEVQRKQGRRWKHVTRVVRPLDASGRFSRQLPRLKRGTYRVRAVYLGSKKARASRSAYRVFRIRL